jgi:hypothetical protein
MSRGFDIAFYVALGICCVGLLGLYVVEFLPDFSTVLPRATFGYWALAALFGAFAIIGFTWLLVLRARLQRHISGR